MAAYRGGVDFEDENRVRRAYVPESGLLFRLLQKLGLAKTDKAAAVWCVALACVLLFFALRIFMGADRTVPLPTGRVATPEESYEYNKQQPPGYDFQIRTE